MLIDSLLRFGPYQFDAARGQLQRGSQIVKLTPKALALLRLFVTQPGQVVTKEELFRTVWADTVVSDAALTACILELRQALRDNARTPRYIETVHRRGFRFIATVVSSQHSVVSREDENQTPALSLAEGAHSDITEQAEDLNLEASGTSPPSPSILEPAAYSLSQDSALSPQSSPASRFRRSFVLAAVLLLTATILTVQYLSRPSLSTQSSFLSPDTAPAALPLPDKPSLVVLPFTNLSGDPGQDYFSDGITEDLITDFSRLPSLFVIARHSAFTYKDKAVKIQEVGKELGVRYVLEGSVQRSEQRVRITAQLVDALSGDHLWVERYDRAFSDIFALQDEIVQKIVTTLKLQLTLQKQGYIVRKTTNNPDAYDSFLRGTEYYYRYTKEANTQAQQLFEKAIELAPRYAEAYAKLSLTYYLAWAWRWSQDPHTLERALALAQQAIALDDTLPLAHGALGQIYAQQQQYDHALAESERAIALAPNDAIPYSAQAEVLNLMGKPEEALRLVEQAMRLNPHYPAGYLVQSGWAYHSMGRYEEAIARLKTGLLRNPNILSAYIFLVHSYNEQWVFQQSLDPQMLNQAFATAQRAIALSNASPYAHIALGYNYLLQQQYEQAIAEMERAIALDPNLAEGYAALAAVLSPVGRAEEALGLMQKVLLLDPPYAAQFSYHLGLVYSFAGRYEEAIAPLKRFLARLPNFLGAHLVLASVYSELGREAEARVEAAEVLRLNPHYSLEIHKQRAPIKDPAMLERQLAALRKAGLK